MRFFISRICIHFVVFLLSLLFLYFSKNFDYTTSLLISIVAGVNIIGEFAFAIFVKGDKKDCVLKIMAIRTTKFLCYLVLTLPFVLFAEPANKLFDGVLLVILFFVYAGVEFSYFKMNKE